MVQKSSIYHTGKIIQAVCRLKKNFYRLVENACQLFSLDEYEKEKLVNRAGLSFQGIDNFSDYIKILMKEKQIEGKDLYSNALISERMYYYIRAGKYVTKYSLISMGIILNLDYMEIDDMLMKAGYKLSSSIAYDAVVSYILNNSSIKGAALLDNVNNTLYSLRLPLLMTRSLL